MTAAGADELPPTLVFDYPSADAITDFVLALLPPALAPQLQPTQQILPAAAATGSATQPSGTAAVLKPKPWTQCSLLPPAQFHLDCLLYAGSM